LRVENLQMHFILSFIIRGGKRGDAWGNKIISHCGTYIQMMEFYTEGDCPVKCNLTEGKPVTAPTGCQHWKPVRGNYCRNPKIRDISEVASTMDGLKARSCSFEIREVGVDTLMAAMTRLDSSLMGAAMQ